MNKKILSLVLALVMVLGTFANVFATETTKKAEDAKEAPKAEKVEKVVGKDNKIQYIIDKKIVEGYEDGSYGYDKNIKRSEITRLLVLANGNEELAKKLQGSMQVYTDVDTKHWANGVITVGTTKPSDANGIAMLAGYPDKSFKPEANVTYAELAKMLVVLAKKDLTNDMVKNAVWASSWMTWAAQLGILDDVTIADSNAAATRADAFTMLYNAIYKMKDFKRVMANDKIGVLSYMNRNGKLVLNQDDKDQTYTITDETVFVNLADVHKSNVVKVTSLNNPEYYFGSLVRILFNDKKEVTHIVELGNPRVGALGVAYNTNAKNSRWAGVAEYTVSTKMYDVTKANDFQNYESYAKVNLNNSRLGVETIEFVKPSEKLKVNDKTKFYIANPANNQMREVKDIHEALRLIGYQNYKDDNNAYKIPNVYAGYDTAGFKSTLFGHANEDRVARVVVFNVVNKEAKTELYRVVNASSTLGNATLEDTDGKTMDKDFFGNITRFPLNYGNLYDVVKVAGYRFVGEESITVALKHKNTEKYPIVEVFEVRDHDNVVLTDGTDKALVYLGDADIFNAKQYKDLRVGDKVQFAANDEGKVDILSILPRDTKLAGYIGNKLKNVIANNTLYIDKVQTAGTYKDQYRLYVRTARNVYDLNDGANRMYLLVSQEDYNNVSLFVKTYPNAKLIAYVEKDGFASNFRLASNGEAITEYLNDAPNQDAKKEATKIELKATIDEANKLYDNSKKEDEAKKDLEKAIKAAEEVYNAAKDKTADELETAKTALVGAMNTHNGTNDAAEVEKQPKEIDKRN